MKICDRLCERDGGGNEGPDVSSRRIDGPGGRVALRGAGRHLPEPRGQPAVRAEPRRPPRRGQAARLRRSGWRSTGMPTAVRSSTRTGRTVHADLITVDPRARAAGDEQAGRGHHLRPAVVEGRCRKRFERLGGRPVRERVGHSFMKETMRKEGCVGGGELSGHFYFADNYFTDCGVLAAIDGAEPARASEGTTLKAGGRRPTRVYHSTDRDQLQGRRQGWAR